MPSPIARFGALLVSAAILSACGSSSGMFPGVELDILGPSEEVETYRLPPLTTRIVSSVERLEVGTLYDGISLTAWGEAPGGGWFGPRLSARRGGLPGPDGFLEFDFVAAPPEVNGAAPGTPGPARVRADAVLTARQLGGVAGIRVFAASGPIQVRFAPQG